MLFSKYHRLHKPASRDRHVRQPAVQPFCSVPREISSLTRIVFVFSLSQVFIDKEVGRNVGVICGYFSCQRAHDGQGDFRSTPDLT